MGDAKSLGYERPKKECNCSRSVRAAQRVTSRESARRTSTKGLFDMRKTYKEKMKMH
jgi:hypothetical protein